MQVPSTHELYHDIDADYADMGSLECSRECSVEGLALCVGDMVVAACPEIGGEAMFLAELFCRASTATGGDEVLLVGKPCNMVPGSRTKTAAKYVVQEALVTVPARQVRRRCEHCPYTAGIVLVLWLQDPAL